MMKRLILIIVSIFFTLNLLLAQGQDNIADIKKRITKNMSLISSGTQKKKDRTTLIEELKSGYEQLEAAYETELSKKNNKIQELETENTRYKHILISDNTIFNMHDIFDDAPKCLEKHMVLIKKIQELSMKIEEIEKRIENIQNQSPYSTKDEKKIIIKRELASEIDNLYEIFNEICNLDKSTLSDEQRTFYEPGLTERANKFLIYF